MLHYCKKLDVVVGR